jgi:tRNA G18 (ribose-2'-O)-methylase SpoU
MAVLYDPKNEFLKDEILEALAEIRNPFEIAVFGSENSFNFGAIIRTSHNFLSKRLWGVDVSWYYPKAAMTARQWEKQNIHLVSIDEFLVQNKDRNIVAFERKNDLDSKDLRTFIYPENPILFFGSEKTGVPNAILAKAHSVVSIPVQGFVLDYNVATAAGIACYDWLLKHSRPNIFKANS